MAEDVYFIHNLHVSTWYHRHPFPESLGSVERVMAYIGDVSEYIMRPPQAHHFQQWLARLVLRLPPKTKQYILLLDQPWEQMALSDVELMHWPPTMHTDRSGKIWTEEFCYMVKEKWLPPGMKVKFARISRSLRQTVGGADKNGMTY